MRSRRRATRAPGRLPAAPSDGRLPPADVSRSLSERESVARELASALAKTVAWAAVDPSHSDAAYALKCRQRLLDEAPAVAAPAAAEDEDEDSDDAPLESLITVRRRDDSSDDD